MLANILHDLGSISSLDHHYYRITTRAKSNISPKRFLASDAPNVFIIISPRQFIGYYDHFSYYSQNEGDRPLSFAKLFPAKS